MPPRFVRQTHRRLQTLPILLAAGCLFIASGAKSQQALPEKGEQSRRPAWTWSAEERLARRFDSEAMEARAAKRSAVREQMEKRFPDMAADSGPSRKNVDSIRGDETPELFLQWELFDSLLDRGFSAEGLDQRETRREIEERAAALGVGNDLWQRLGRATSSLLSLQSEQFRRAMRSAHSSGQQKPDGWTGDDLLYCKTRAEAIAAAKAEFGDETFLRLLYEAVAPLVTRTYTVERGTAENFLYIERGCR